MAKTLSGRYLSSFTFLFATLLLAGCGSATKVTSQSEQHAAMAAIAQLPPGARRDLLSVATQQIGTPYRYGGIDQRGFDCSGLVRYAHSRIGIDVPRTTGEQWRHGRAPRDRQLLPGDLVFFRIDGGTRHVGIYLGGGQFIHAPSSGKRVGRASLDNPYWRTRMIGARSFL